MKINKILSLAFASALLFASISCLDDVTDGPVIEPKYANGIFIANEGGFSTPTSEVAFISNDLTNQVDDIYKLNNNGEVLGNVLQSIGFRGNYAYLVSNVPNKITLVNRYTFEKAATVTQNLDNPRYIAFSGNQFYVTNNNFNDVKKVNVYNIHDNSYVKSIPFDRYAEKIVEAGGKIVVQTDGVTYDSNYNEVATGHTVTVIQPSNNNVEHIITLPNNGIIRDLISYNGEAYALASDNANSYIYKIDALLGTYTTTTLTGLPQMQKLKADSNRFYFSDYSNNIYSMAIGGTTLPSSPFVTTTGYLYGFDIIDGKIFASDASFTGNSTVYVYDASTGAQLKTFTAGIGTNGFYKN